MAAVCVCICRFISFLNLLYILQFYMVRQPKGLCYRVMTKFNAKASFIKNNQELKFPRQPISIWYKHGPTCLVLPIDLTATWMLSLILVPYRRYQFICWPVYLRFLWYLAWSRIQVINCCLRIMLTPTVLDFVVLTIRMSTIDFLNGLVHCH